MSLDQSTETATIRVLVADNTRMHTQLLTDALRRDRRLEVIGSASHSRDLLEAVAAHNIDVAVISSSLDEESLRGLEVLRELRAARPELCAVILLDSSKREAVVDAFRAGARGVFSRHDSLETLSKCVRHVHEGQIWANGQQMVYAVEALASAPTVRAVGANGLNLLSKREMDVVHCLAEGLSNREIAERLGLSQHTIKNYLFRVFDKLGVSSRLELLFLTLAQPASHAGSSANGRGNSLQNGDGQGAMNLASCQKAAEQGQPGAQLALAQMYTQGKGVAKDLVAAYMWYLVSEQASLDLKDEITGAKRKLANLLTTEEIIDAQKKAAERLRKPPKATAPSAMLTPTLLNC